MQMCRKSWIVRWRNYNQKKNKVKFNHSNASIVLFTVKLWCNFVWCKLIDRVKIRFIRMMIRDHSAVVIIIFPTAIVGFRTMEVISCFIGPTYGFLSNFYICDVEFEGIMYPSSEAAYQAAKTMDLKERLVEISRIRNHVRRW
jgi:hypothetical protein